MGQLGLAGQFCCSMSVAVAEVTQVAAFSRGTLGTGTSKVGSPSPRSLSTWWSVAPQPCLGSLQHGSCTPGEEK